MRLLGARGAGAERLWRARVRQRQRARRRGGPPGHQGLRQLADDPAALRQRRIRRRLGHHDGDVPGRRAAASSRQHRRVSEAARRVVVGVTGATGALYAVRLLERLKAAGREIHLVASPAGVLNVHHELGLDRKALEALADVAYSPSDVGAAIASGSFATDAML